MYIVPQRSVSSPGALCVGPGALCVGARRSDPGALCVRYVSVSGPGSLSLSATAPCVGPRCSLCRAPCQGPGMFIRMSPSRSAGPSSDPRATLSATHPISPASSHPQPLIRPRGPPAPAPPIQSAGPQLRSACHPSSSVRSLFPGENPTPYCLGEY